MDRNREGRRSGMVSATSNGSLRRRHRSNSLRDSPDEDGGVEIQESVRLRERVKKDRDRERDRDRDRTSRSKRRRGDRMMIHREDGGDDSSEESVNDDEEDEDDETNNNNTISNSNSNTNTNVVSGSTRLLPMAAPNAGVGSITANHHIHHHGHNHGHNHGHGHGHGHNQNHHLQPPRKSFPPNAAKVLRPAAPVWKPGDEMIGVSVPRKARSATKRSHDWVSGGSSGGGNIGVVAGDLVNQQAPANSPVRHNIPAASTPSPAAPLSPSSSNVSVRKKIKPSGSKRPPVKSPPKASSSNPEELEIEIAEVLYGLMTQSQPSKKENGPSDTKEVSNRSRVSSPVSNSNSSATPLSAVAPKRKRPRQVLENSSGFGIRNSPISSSKAEMDHSTMKIEVSSPNLEKTPQSAAENGVSLYDLSASVHSLPDPAPEPEKAAESEAKRRLHEESEFSEAKEEVSSPKRESSSMAAENSNRDDTSAVGATQLSVVSEGESQREEKFQIDLMAPPPQLRSSPEREAEISFVSATSDNKPVIAENTVEMKPLMKEKDEEKISSKGEKEVEAQEKKIKSAVEELKASESRGRNIDLQLDLEKPEKDSGKIQQQQSQKLLQQQQHQPPPSQKATKEESTTDKAGQSSSLPMPMSMASWPGGLPPMGYMAPLQGVVAMDGSGVSSAPIQPLFSQPRPKRCATHCYIARNIHYLQQFMKMHPFWPPAAVGSAPFFGPKTNLNVMPGTDLHGSLGVTGRGASATGPEKGQGLAIFPTNNAGKDKVQPANIADAAQRKQQILLQQALPPVAPNNLLHGPAFIFPINQQQAAAAAAARPGPSKSPSTTGPAISSNTSNPAAGTSSATAGGAATAISFNYPNMSPNEAQYLAILQNNAYAFPIPAVGAPPNYRGTHPQPLPLFNGSFYSSQMIHPSQVQQQPPQQPPSTSQSQQVLQVQPNTSMSSGSSSSQKHLQSQQQRSQNNAVNGGSGGGNLHNFPGTKNHPSQSPSQSQNQHLPPHTRQIENDVGSEDSPSVAERKRSHGPINMYNQNFPMPIHPSNFGLMTPPGTFGVASSAGSGSNHQTEKKSQQQQQQQQPGLKTTLESVPPQPFAMSFASFNGATAGPGIDMSMAQNHAIFQSLPEATRQNLQMAAAAAAQAVQQKKNFRISEDGKSGSGDQSGADAERKGLAMKPSGNAGQSIAFSRSDMSDASGSTIAANSVIESSSRSINLPSGASWSARAAMPNALGAVNVPNSQFQAQIQHQQQQMIQLHKQQQQQQQQLQQQQQQQLAAAVAARSKTSASSNGNVYSDHLTSSASAASKFPNTISTFPQNLVQTSSSGGQAQSPQWKNSTRTSTSQAPSSLSSSSLKNLSQQQQVRAQQGHTQISFGTNQKSGAPPQGQQPPNSNQSPSSPMMVGSPTTSSLSKGASGSPRTTTSASTSNKAGQNSSLSTQQVKSSSVPNQKSSPAGGRNVPSILGNPHIASTSGGGTKTQQQQQQQLQQQQQMQKGMQQAQLFFSSPYMQAQQPHSSGTSSTAQGTGGYYLQRRRSDQTAQQPPGSSAASSTGMLTLCPVTLGGGTTSDPAKAIAAAAAATAASNMKGGVLPSQGILHAAQFAPPTSGSQHQLLPAGYSYVNPVPAAMQVKPAEQKQPAGNDNLHACWQPEKK